MKLLKILAKQIHQFICKHDDVFVRNIYGDEIAEIGWNRSVWRCKKCNKVTCKSEFVNNEF